MAEKAAVALAEALRRMILTVTMAVILTRADRLDGHAQRRRAHAVRHQGG
ncbi:MAG TPA: hypothetical protein PKZ67_06575 [Accumulibacter sp.]|uniref:Uncharacterized protein n=1 Tax=Candidatus Accumulibacter cognatus TaxID=2954383 RepID=A0A7D5ND57_9PROT|nr:MULTISPECIES: hypothetical protein [Candidatus Accumulibacter]MBL8399805.1 hypothetical protein [Accumulibacter sp.]MCC2867291.1 hypothetical protein [Candidatus Accumulibacter phosphatis]MCM8622968.1 hypothetical protein [Accumulibacter sp.]MCQ1547311.1 hypothetical protein [Candidatus Accumulibacter phosphatis]QLH51734.1 MAG: hypothetical protein HWD57_19480 [Candidatus Accumulibacter cognatus]